MRILITGGCGFIGHHFVEHFLRQTDWQVVVMDNLTYASRGLDRLRAIKAEERVGAVITHDFSVPVTDNMIKEIGHIDYLVHLAAETHVDFSITDPWRFIQSNVIGTYHMLEMARKMKPRAVAYFSTDEVFGPAPPGISFREVDGTYPSNPYAATKHAGEDLCLAYHNTFKVPVFITRTMNVFGERQSPEKFIPTCVKKIMAGERVIIHADKDKQVSGSRFWIHARNVAAHYLYLIANVAHPGVVYHIVGEQEVSNLEIAQRVATIIGKPLDYEMVDYHSSRPGHDLRYAMENTRYKFEAPLTFWPSFGRCVNWMAAPENREWLD